ncbi:oxidoreductase, 2-nitropropane dioxygenase family [Metarhizium acridum CQMa 102]|uniref:Oxidoreductase, 2-nitropropane dioxygenase family n=1 Tax=Metarhizium acridum (strain CQMa 102) TaxID=655827 RepID=E9EEY2_METAQ|nr:oxidoreductase, 2-nitropropane dioxygenase family [Metarhizium acridum CQMa 102]EFY85538.1 oxidoreductase, 2-nitropropane dioxygenase family [Metarhizium acridum CQMa 102]
MASPQQIRTPITDLFKIQHPILLAGMNVAAGPKLAAAVTNAGGLGVIGGVGYTPDMLREQISELKEYLTDKNAPFGVDLLLPQVGGNARKTKITCFKCADRRAICDNVERRRKANRSLFPATHSYDYTKGKLDELVDIVIESGAKLFVSAVGVPPKHVVQKLQKAGVLYMNMIGHVKHVKKCLDLGVDIICAQGGEGGGHTGDIPTTVLIPAVVEAVKGHKSPVSGGPVQVVAAGGIHNGQLLASALMMGASGVWVGTRFILTDEAGAPKAHKDAVRTAGHDDNVRTIIFTGRPMRVRNNPYINDWETNRIQEMKELTAKGTIPYEVDLERFMSGEAKEHSGVEAYSSNAASEAEDDDEGDDPLEQFRPYLMGKCAAVVNEQKSAKAVVDEFVNDAVAWIKKGNQMIAKL